MTTLIRAGMWIPTLVGVVLLAAAAIGRAPARLVFALAGLAEAAVLLGVIADIALLVQGPRPDDMITHVSYLLSVPFFIPLGVALTYRKLDRWGLVLVASGCLLTAVLVLRQLQTLGIAGA